MLPDPDFLFLSKKHQAALTLLEYGMLNHAGFCVISGEPGAGKTTIIRALLSTVSDDVTVGLITNTHRSFGGLLDSLQQLGPMARYVEDLVLLLPILAGPDLIDPYVHPVPLLDPEDVALRDLRVCFHTDNGIATPTPETIEAVRAAARQLADAGADVEEARPDGIESSYQIMLDLWDRCDPPLVKDLLEKAGTTPERSTLDWLWTVPATANADIVDAVTRADACRSRMLSFFKDYDLILCPVNSQPAPPHRSQENGDLSPFSYTMTYNLTGWPGAVVRGGTSPGGLPIGV